jgi:hypothetical protein
MAGAKDDSPTPKSWPPLCALTRTASEGSLQPIQSLSNCASGRAIADDLGLERNRLANRLREQFWRYSPALLELEDDLSAEWLFEFLERAPTPAKASRLREATVANLLTRRRIRRLEVGPVLEALRRPPLQVASGTIEAASAHVASLIPRNRLLNRQTKDAGRKPRCSWGGRRTRWLHRMASRVSPALGSSIRRRRRPHRQLRHPH